MRMINLQEFMASGMAFFKGQQETENKAQISDALEKLKSELEASHSAILATINSEVEKLKQLLAEKTEALEVLEQNFVTAGEQARAALSAASVPPVSVPAEPANIAPKGFVELVHERMATGKSKAESIGFCIKNFPAAYVEARSNGGLGKI